MPERTQALLREAVTRHRAGRLDEAARLYQDCLARDPALLPALYYGGLLAMQRGRFREAIGLLTRLTRHDPSRAEAWYQLGLAQAKAGDTAAARRGYEQALTCDPRCAPAANNLGLLLQATGDAAGARRLFETACSADPSRAEHWNNLGRILHESGELERAIASYRQATRHGPSLFEPWLNLGAALADAGVVDEALTCLEHAARLPGADAAKAWTNLGAVLHECEQLDRAAEAYGAALAADPRNRAAQTNLARIELERGDAEAARALYGRMLMGKGPGQDAIRMRLATLVPPIPDSEAQIDTIRRDFRAGLVALRARPLHLTDPLAEVGEPPFYLSYHGREDDRDLLGELAQTYLAACPSLAWTAGHCTAPRSADGRRIRIGFASHFFFEHSIGKTMQAIIASLPAERFDVHLLRVPPFVDDARARAIAASAHAVHRLPATLAGARAAIAALELDVLFYADLGTEPLTYYLAYARLAPVQCVTWGHPTTSGIPTIDFYLSHPELEPEGSERFYSERLVRLDTGAIYPGYPAPVLPESPATRADLGLPDTPVFVCPQSAFKLVPAYDVVLAEILHRCPDALLLVPEEKHPRLTAQLQARWARAMPDAVDRVRFFARRALPEFCNLIANADVMLDPFPVGGGVSTHDAMSFGTPIVTRPGPQMRSRFAAACYRRMGQTDLIAPDTAAYVDLACTLATDRARCAALRVSIRATAPALYDNLQGIEAYARWFEQAVATAASR